MTTAPQNNSNGGNNDRLTSEQLAILQFRSKLSAQWHDEHDRTFAQSMQPPSEQAARNLMAGLRLRIDVLEQQVKDERLMAAVGAIVSFLLGSLLL